MTNAFEALIDYFKGNLDEESESKLHVGEVMGCWLYHTALIEEIPALEISLNTTTDNELRALIEDSIKLAASQIEQLERFMKEEGIPSSPPAAHKPDSNPNAVPLGAKSTDSEIANLISVKVASNIVMTSTNLSQSIRNNLGIMWLKFHTEKVMFGSKVKQVMKRKGWLKIPPYYYPPGMPDKQ